MKLQKFQSFFQRLLHYTQKNGLWATMRHSSEWMRIKLFGLYDRNWIRKEYEAGFFSNGINLIGLFRGNLGLGEGIRNLCLIAKRTGAPYANVNVDLPSVKQNEALFSEELSKQAKYSINVVHVNPPEMPYLRKSLRRESFDRHYNIGFWLWELESIPNNWRSELKNFDEFWAPSAFICNTLKKETSKPVHCIPYGIQLDTDGLYDRAYFDLPEDAYLCLCMFDSNSYMCRKNPFAAMDAFIKAFGDKSRKAKMIVKINHASPSDLDALRRYVDGNDDFIFWTRALDRSEVNSLIHCADTYVSLHRSEGFGLVIAEAMYLGVPTVVTNWSANTDFSKPGCACLVDYSLIPVGENYLYDSNQQVWANADVAQAAEYLKKLHDDPQYRRSIADNGRKYIQEEYSVEKCADKMNKRLHQIYDDLLYTVEKKA